MVVFVDAATVAALAVGIRAVVRELRWWPGLRGTSPDDRAEIIRAMRAPGPEPRPMPEKVTTGKDAEASLVRG